MFIKRMVKWALALGGLFLLFVCYSAYSIWSYSNESQYVTTDAAIVLGAAAWDDQPSPVLTERINHALWLYKNGYVEKIIFTGGKSEEATYAESEVAKQYALEHNVSAEDIFIETRSRITEENLTYAAELAESNDLNSFTIVSDPLHMKRAMFIAKDLEMNVYSSPTTTSAYQTIKSKLPFFLRELFFYVGYMISLPFR